jgi:hypothetical protein
LKNWQPLALGAVISFLYGVATVFVSTRGNDVLIAVMLIFPLFWWLQADSRHYEHLNLGSLKILAVLLAIIFVPVYLIRTRGWGGGVLAILAFIGLLTGSEILVFLGYVIAGFTQGYSFEAMVSAYWTS